MGTRSHANSSDEKNTISMIGTSSYERAVEGRWARELVSVVVLVSRVGKRPVRRKRENIYSSSSKYNTSIIKKTT